jgi:RNA polymerase-associated protein LEO1
MSDEEDQLFGDQDSDHQLGENEEEDIFGAAEEDQDQYETQEIESRILETTIPRYPPSGTPGKDTYFARVPAFVTLEPHPFDSEKFLQDVENQSDKDSDRLRLEDENTVRWRYARDEKGNMTKQSNARFVRWSDGTLSLQLGAEIFDVTEQDPYEPTFLCLSHPSNELLQTSALLNKNMTIVPTSTASHTHKRLTQALADRQRSITVGSFATVDDPEKRQREAEKQQQLNLRAKKKLESKQRLAREREYGLGGRAETTARYGSYNRDADDEEGAGFRHSREEYEEDDFVVDDEEEGDGGEDGDEEEEEAEDDILDVVDEEDEQARAERLHKVKQRGAEIYRERERERDTEGQNGGDVDKEESEKRKRRRIIDEEDDE